MHGSNTMTAKEYLRQYQEAKRRELRCKTEYEAELEQIDNVCSTLGGDGMPHGSGVSRRTEDAAIKLADKALKWKDAELEAIRIRQDVFELINGIDGVEGEILYQRYINLHKWEAVCVIVHLSWYAVHDRHKKALRIVQKRLDEKST